MKKMFVVLTIVVAVVLSPITILASDFFSAPTSLPTYMDKNNICEHKGPDFTWNGVETDVCKNCCYERLHYTNEELPFITRIDNTSARTEPRKTSPITRTLPASTNVTVVARIRNENNHVWCLTDKDDYIFVDNLAFDFDTLSIMAYQLSCVSSDSTVTLKAMYELYKTDGIFDLKSIKMLGSNNTKYFIKVQNTVPDKRYTGEELGNILYGYNAAMLNLEEDGILRIGSAGADITSGGADNYVKAATCLFTGFLCDSQEDQDNIIKGIDYYKTQEWPDN